MEDFLRKTVYLKVEMCSEGSAIECVFVLLILLVARCFKCPIISCCVV